MQDPGLLAHQLARAGAACAGRGSNKVQGPCFYGTEVFCSHEWSSIVVLALGREKTTSNAVENMGNVQEMSETRKYSRRNYSENTS
jgi:hypothetical protein